MDCHECKDALIEHVVKHYSSGIVGVKCYFGSWIDEYRIRHYKCHCQDVPDYDGYSPLTLSEMQ